MAIKRPELLAEAWRLPVAAKYQPLLSQGFTSICGPTSVANVLRSIGVKSGKNPLRGFGVRAMSLDQVVSESAEVVPAGWQVSAVRAASVDELRAVLRSANDERHRLIANFDRSVIFSRGGGHHSPVGGYLEKEDLAFVLDVNSSFGPWLVPTPTLFDAMSAAAGWRGESRGLARFERVA